MTEQTWVPLFRAPNATITKVLQSPAFTESRKRAGAIVDDPGALRDLADAVERLDHAQAPLSAVADRVAAAVRFLRARADRLDQHPDASATAAPVRGRRLPTPAGSAARERLIVAALHYLVTPVDLVPDFRVGGYVDDVFLLGWVFGAAVRELGPHLADDPGLLGG